MSALSVTPIVRQEIDSSNATDEGNQFKHLNGSTSRHHLKQPAKIKKQIDHQGFLVFVGPNSLHYVIERAQSLGHSCIFAKDLNAKSVKSFGSFPSWQQFYKAYNLCLTKHLYEIIQTGLPVRLFLDTEHYGELIFDGKPTKADLQALDNKVIQLIVNLLQSFINRPDINTSNFCAVTASSSKRRKTSCHVVFHDIIFKSGVDLKYFMDYFSAYIHKTCLPSTGDSLTNGSGSASEPLLFYQTKKSKTALVIDKSVYHTNPNAPQNFRLLHSSKFGDSNSTLQLLPCKKRAVPSNANTFLDSLAQLSFNAEQLARCIIVYPAGVKEVVVGANSKTLSARSRIYDPYTQDTHKVFSKTELQPLIDSIASILQEQFHIKLSWIDCQRSTPTYLYVNNNGESRKCPWATDGYHISNHAFVTLTNKYVSFHCFGNECLGKQMRVHIETNIAPVNITRITEDKSNKLAKTNDLVIPAPVMHPLRTDEHHFTDMVLHRIVKGKYIQHDLGDVLSNRERFRLLRSPPGTGKTSYMAKEFKRIIQDHPSSVCVAISPRCSVTQQHFKSFKKLGFIHYSQNKDDLVHADRIIITLDSLVKIDKEIEVIYIDEVESLLEHVFADTIKHRNQVWQKLLHVCSHAKFVIATDADFGDLSISFFKTVLNALCQNNILPPQMLQQSTLFLDNIQPTEPLNIHISQYRHLWYHQLEQLLTCKSSKLFIGCDSRKAACNLSQQIKAWLKSQPSPPFASDKVLLYTSHDGDKHDLIDVNSSWANAKVVICSPTVVYGIDYDNTVSPFTAVMGFYTQQGRTLGADKVRQQLRRARTINRLPHQPWHIYIYIFSPPFKQNFLAPLFPTSTVAIRQQLQDLCSSFCSEISQHLPITIDGMGNAQIATDPLTDLYVEFIRKRNLSKFNLLPVLRQLLLFEHHIVRGQSKNELGGKGV